MKEKFLSTSSTEEIRELEKIMTKDKRDRQFSILNDPARNHFYNTILNDKEMKEHLLKIFGVNEDVINNVLMINGCPPLDDFAE